MSRRALCAWTAVAVFLVPPIAMAQNYPERPIRFIVGFTAGGANDIIARIVGQRVSQILGQMIVVENHAGANTLIATELGVRAAPDGYTLLNNSPGHVTNAAFRPLKFHPVNDFAFVTLMGKAPNLLVVHPSLPVNNVRDLIALSKKSPGQLNFASSGVGTTVHLSAELFQQMTGTKWVHIPYNGGAPAATGLIVGETQVYCGALPTLMSLSKAGKVRSLAVTSLARSVSAPQIPTIAESGVPGFDVTAWYGVSAPAKTPRAIVDRLNRAFVEAIKSPDVRERVIGAGAEPAGSTPEQYASFIQDELTKWTKVIKEAGIKAQ